MEQKLGSDLGNIVNWCDENKTAINYDKTKVMLLTTYQKYHTLPVKEIKITINNKTLENIKQQKLLGIVVDQNLSWKQYIDNFHKTVSMLLVCFRCVKPFLPTNGHITFCKAFIFHIWSTVVQSANLDRLYKLQKRAAHVLFDHPTRTPTLPLLNELKWMTPMDRVSYHQAVMVYQSLSGLAPLYRKDMFTSVKDVNNRNTRNADTNKLYLPGGKNLKKFTDSFFYSAAIICNSIPVDVREVDSLACFKTQYVKWFLNKE